MVKTKEVDFLFIILYGVFLTSLVTGNLIGTTKFIEFISLGNDSWFFKLIPSYLINDNKFSLVIPAGVIAYPITFLATDLMCEFYGRRNAEKVVFSGFLMNLLMLLVMTIGDKLPASLDVSAGEELFSGVYKFLISNTIASMIAYLTAQYVDVRLYHYWKKLTKDKHLWLRNNASTMISQLIDSTIIILILYYAGNLGDAVSGYKALIILIFNSYIFKFFFALCDTPIMYLIVFLVKSKKSN